MRKKRNGVSWPVAAGFVVSTLRVTYEATEQGVHRSALRILFEKQYLRHYTEMAKKRRLPERTFDRAMTYLFSELVVFDGELGIVRLVV